MPAPRECPCCLQLQRTGIYVQRFAPIGGRVTLNGYTVVSCDHCGMIFADGIPTQHELDEFYAHASKYVYSATDGRVSPSDAKRLRQTAKAIATHVPDRSARILDVGSSTGRLLHELRELGYTEVRGEDPAPECGPLAQALYGVTVRESGHYKRGEYELISLVGVVEHVRDVRAFLTRLVQSLSLHGQLYIEVPDVAAFGQFANAPFQELSPEHINFFSQISIATLLAQLDLTVTQCDSFAREQGPQVFSPTLCLVARRTHPGEKADAWKDDSASARLLHGYLIRSAADDVHLRNRLHDRLDKHARVIIWGVGALTRRLGALHELSRSEVVAFADSDPRLTGGDFLGRTILSPAEAIAHGAPILPLSRQHGDAIRAQIPATVQVLHGVI